MLIKKKTEKIIRKNVFEKTKSTRAKRFNVLMEIFSWKLTEQEMVTTISTLWILPPRMTLLLLRNCYVLGAAGTKHAQAHIHYSFPPSIGPIIFGGWK